MADKGFTIHGTFYPFVGYQDWLNRDYVLAWKLTDSTTDEIFADTVKLEQALVAVAVKHATPLDRDQVIEFVGQLKPDEIEDVGFDDEAAPSPLAPAEPNANGDSSSRSSDGSTGTPLETSKTGSSGLSGSGSGSQA